MNKAPVITIDGPSASGKGTISQLLAIQLGWHYLDSGTLYRVLAAVALQQHLTEKSEDELAHLAQQLIVNFIYSPATGFQAVVDGNTVPVDIRSEACSKMASKISALTRVRQALLEKQRAFRQLPGLVTDGRDMGTVVFPDAELKFFLTASPDVRAQRRYEQLKEKDNNVSLSDILAELVARDKRDTERSVAPLMPADDAVLIDTSNLNIEQVLASIFEYAKSKFQLL